MALVQSLHYAGEILQTVAGRRRVVIEDVRPEVDCGRFPIKRIAGEKVIVEANIFADGHDQVSGRLLYRHGDDPNWIYSPMRPLGNDRWQGEFTTGGIGRYWYAVEGWVDHLATWRADFLKRVNAGQDTEVDLSIGAELIEDAARRAPAEDARQLSEWADILRHEPDCERRRTFALREDLIELGRRYFDSRLSNRYAKELGVMVERERAGFSAWYEMFPRSCSPEPGHHGTFRDCEKWLPYVASMGFDVLYLPPIHPIGASFRKGKNNSTAATTTDVGSPWAIGSADGGHTAIHPELGSMADFRHFVSQAKEFGLEVALDIAFQATPDHPYVVEHSEWFRRRPDGTIQYAENPPKKYQDIYPFDFDSAQWRELWMELERIVLFWANEGIRIFRVDNPHTKPFAFWEWLIADVRNRHPDAIFLAEAFTRPHVMQRLAKLGFSQSYSYFAWRNTKQELVSYFTEMVDARDYFRPNLWPNTPDILTSYLQTGGVAAFAVRAVLAATLGANYGVYGPAFELAEHTPRDPGTEEYLCSEKYELKTWDVAKPGSLHNLLSRLNHIRRGNAALHRDAGLTFHDTDNEHLICYSKTTEDRSNVVAVVVNLDPHNKHWGFVTLDLDSLAIDAATSYQAVDLLHGQTYVWKGSRNYVELTPEVRPAHILRLRNGA